MRKRSVVAVTSLVIVFTAPSVRAAVSSKVVSPYPGGRYQPPPATYGTSEDQNLGVVTDDGTRISVDVVYPTDPATGKRITNQKFPVLLTQDPYAGGAVDPAESAASGGAPPGAYFVERGYIFVHMDIRGTGSSQGTENGAADLFSPREGLDGLEVAYWAAKPTNVAGSDGIVGLEGCSALGISQLATLMQLGKMEREGGGTISYNGVTRTVTAQTNPIRASIPQCLSGNLYGDTFFDNGIPSPINLLNNPATGLALSGANTNNPSQNANLSIADLLAGGDIGYYRGFWQTNDRVAFADDIARTGVPVLGWVGWGEGGFIGAQELYGVFQNAAAGKPNPWGPMTPGQKPSPKYQMIIGDWGHAGGLDPGIEIEWYDTWIKNVDTGLRSADEPLHMQELLPKSSTDSAGVTSTTERFVNATTYPELSNYSAYYLANNGALATSPQASGTADQLVWTPQDSVTYELSKPFSQDMTIMGPPAVRVWASSSGTNMSLFAELEDVDPATGTVTAITHGSILESRRQTNPSKSWTIAAGVLGTESSQPQGLPLAPYLTLTQDDYSTPANTPVELNIPIQPVTWRLTKGHLLELEIATQAPQSECTATAKIGAPPTGCVYTKPMLETLPGTYQILHDSEHQSELTIAMVPSSSLVDAQAKVTPTSSGVALPSYWGG